MVLFYCPSFCNCSRLRTTSENWIWEPPVTENMWTFFFLGLGYLIWSFLVPSLYLQSCWFHFLYIWVVLQCVCVLPFQCPFIGRRTSRSFPVLLRIASQWVNTCLWGRISICQGVFIAASVVVQLWDDSCAGFCSVCSSAEWGPLPHIPCSVCCQLFPRLCHCHCTPSLLKFAVNPSRPGLLLLFSLEGFLLLFQFPPFLWVCLGCWLLGLILVDWLNLDICLFWWLFSYFPVHF